MRTYGEPLCNGPVLKPCFGELSIIIIFLNQQVIYFIEGEYIKQMIQPCWLFCGLFLRTTIYYIFPRTYKFLLEGSNFPSLICLLDDLLCTWVREGGDMTSCLDEKMELRSKLMMCHHLPFTPPQVSLFLPRKKCDKVWCSKLWQNFYFYFYFFITLIIAHTIRTRFNHTLTFYF